MTSTFSAGGEVGVVSGIGEVSENFNAPLPEIALQTTKAAPVTRVHGGEHVGIFTDCTDCTDRRDALLDVVSGGKENKTDRGAGAFGFVRRKGER